MGLLILHDTQGIVIVAAHKRRPKDVERSAGKMRAVVVDSIGATPRLMEFPGPEGGAVARVVAAAVNPIDRVIAGGRIAFRSLVPPSVLGLDGVAQVGDGLRYFFAPRVPFGSFAELVPLDGAETASVPAGLDPARAAALGVPGIAAWLSVAEAAHVGAGDAVLVLGATGAVGRLAIQVARLLGAATVAGTARDDAGAALVERLGARPVALSDPDGLDAALARLAPGGFDVVVDMLWGSPLAGAVRHLAPRARVVQVGNSAGPQATVDAPAFRNKGALMLGHSNFLVSPAERMAAYTQIAGFAAQGKVEVAADPLAFDAFDAVWRGEGPAVPVLTF